LDAPLAGDRPAPPLRFLVLTPDFLKQKFEAGQDYEAYLRAGKPALRDSWKSLEHVARDHASLDSHQRASLGDWSRKVKVLVLSGMWCGDCQAQCPLLAIIADARPDLIDLRFLDRDEHMDLAEKVRICGGLRVPTAIFMNEDFEFVSLFGDKSLARARTQAARSLGASCPLPADDAPHDEIAAMMHDWLNEVERVHLLLRLSPKLRARYGD
jgi:thiol-disulfide isomerase/thioredoxin